MNLQCELLIYLDKRSILLEAKSSCEKYLEELTNTMIVKIPPLRFLMEIDVMDLTNLFPDVAEWLLREPLQFQRVCSNILYACVQSINDKNKAIMSAQVGVNLRLKSVSRLSVQPNRRSHSGLLCFKGLLISISKPESYVIHTVWSCPEECEGNEVVLSYIPKVPPKCYVCKSTLFENSGLRRCGERVTAIFKLKNDLLSKAFKIPDDLIFKLNLGSTFRIIASVVKKTVYVMALEEIVPLSAPLSAPIPADIRDLFKACRGIPWQFIYCLASSIGVNICPLQHFMHLKMCLLLSLASVKANAYTGAPIVHVLAASYDTGYVGKLMEKAAAMADRTVPLGTCNTSASSALVASSGGVCVMALPLYQYNQKQTSIILSSIETGEVSTDTSKMKLQSAVWAHGMDYRKMTILNVASVFGTVCRGDYGEHDDEIADFVLQNAVEPPAVGREEVRALRDVVDYIELVAGLEVTLDGKAEGLLRSYFLAARRERRGVAVVSMSALVALCVASARLCRRSETRAEDAVLAAWLHACGAPDPRFAPDEYLHAPADVKSLQKVMDQFVNWLEQFTGTIIF